MYAMLIPHRHGVLDTLCQPIGPASAGAHVMRDRPCVAAVVGHDLYGPLVVVVHRRDALLGGCGVGRRLPGRHCLCCVVPSLCRTPLFKVIQRSFVSLKTTFLPFRFIVNKVLKTENF